MPTIPLRLLPVLLGLALLLIGSSVRAEDEQPKKAGKEPAHGKAPSPITELQEKHLAEKAEPEDPIAYLASYREWVVDHERPPPKDGTNQAVYEVWSAVLRPRARRMTGRLDRLMKRKYWLPEDGTPVRVKSEAWSTFVRELGGLITELHGAYSRYDKVVLRDRGGKLQTSGNRVYDSVYTGYGHPYSRWHSGVVYRQRIGIRFRHLEVNTYWNLMRRYRLGWGWRRGECLNCEKRREELKDRQKKIEQSQQLIDTTRETLREQMLALQVLAAAMQAQEELAIAEKIDALAKDHLLREPAEKLLAALRKARAEAERYDGDSSSHYAQLLRNWVRAYKAGSALLEREAAKLEDSEDDEDSKGEDGKAGKW